MYLRHFKILVIILSVIITLSITPTSTVGIPKSKLPNKAAGQTQKSSVNRNIDVSGFYKIKMTNANSNYCGGYYVYMQICGMQNHLDKGFDTVN